MDKTNDILLSKKTQEYLFKALPKIDEKSSRLLKVIHAIAKACLTFLAFIWVSLHFKTFYPLSSLKAQPVTGGGGSVPSISPPGSPPSSPRRKKIDDIADDEEQWEKATDKTAGWEEYKKSLGSFTPKTAVHDFKLGAQKYDSRMFFHLFSDEAGANSLDYEGYNMAYTLPFMASYLDAYPDIQTKLLEAASLQPLTVEKLKNLKPGSSILLPGGWAGSPSGHAMLYEVIADTDGTYTFRIFNSGEGVDLHQVAAIGLKDRSHAYVDLKKIPLKQFTPEVLLSLVEMKTPSKTAQYNSRFIYGALKELLNPKEIDLGPKNPHYKSMQRAGTCSFFVGKIYAASRFPSVGQFKQWVLDMRLNYLKSLDLTKIPPQDLHMLEMAHSKTARKLLRYQEMGLITEEYVKEGKEILDRIKTRYIEPTSKLEVALSNQAEKAPMFTFSRSNELQKLPTTIEENQNQVSDPVGPGVIQTLSCTSPTNLKPLIDTLIKNKRYDEAQHAIELFCERISLDTIDHLSPPDIDASIEALSSISKSYFVSAHAIPSKGQLHPIRMYTVIKLAYMQKALFGLKTENNPKAFGFPSSFFYVYGKTIAIFSKQQQEEIEKMLEKRKITCPMSGSRSFNIEKDSYLLKLLQGNVQQVAEQFAGTSLPPWLTHFRDGCAYLSLIAGHKIQPTNREIQTALKYEVSKFGNDDYTIRFNTAQAYNSTSYTSFPENTFPQPSKGLKALFTNVFLDYGTDLSEKWIIQTDISSKIETPNFWKEDDLKAVARMFVGREDCLLNPSENQPVVTLIEALHYYTSHPEKLTEVDHQTIFEMVLFSFKLLPNKAFNAQKRKLLSQFIEKQFSTNYHMGLFENALFYIRVSRHLQTFFPDEPVYSSCVEKLDLILKDPKTSVEVKSIGYLEKLALLSHKETISDEEAIEIFVAKTYLLENPIAPTLLHCNSAYEAKMAPYKHYQKMDQVVKTHYPQLIKTLLKELRGNENIPLNNVQFFPFNFVLKTENFESNLPEKIRNHPIFIRLYGSTEKGLFVSPGVYRIGNDMVMMQDQVLHVERKFKGEWHRYISPEQFYNNQDKAYAFPGPLVKEYTHWISPKKPNTLLFTDPKTDQILFVSEDGNLQRARDQKSLENVHLDFSPFEATNQILFYNDEVELPRFGLVFKREGNLWVTESCGERWELQTKRPPTLEPFASFLYVKCPDGRGKYLIPVHPFEPTDKPQAITLRHSMNPETDFHDPTRCPYLTFNDDFSGGTTKGYLKLTEIFLVAGRYKKAIDFLKKQGKKASPYTAEEKKVLESIALNSETYNGDESGQALGIRIHALLYLIEKCGFDKRTEERLLPLYHNYLNHLNHTMSATLSKKDELTLIELILSRGFDGKTYRRLKRLNPQRAKNLQIPLRPPEDKPPEKKISCQESGKHIPFLYGDRSPFFKRSDCRLTQPLESYKNFILDFYHIAREGSESERNWLKASFKYAPFQETKNNSDEMYHFHFLLAVATHPEQFPPFSNENRNTIKETAEKILKTLKTPSAEEPLEVYRTAVREFFTQEVVDPKELSCPVSAQAIPMQGTTLAPQYANAFGKEKCQFKNGRAELKKLFEIQAASAKSSTEKKEWERLKSDLSGTEADVRKFAYTLNQPLDETQLKTELYKDEREALEVKIYDLANQSTLKLSLELDGGLQRVITLEEVLYAYAAQNGAALIKRNPNLTKTDVIELFKQAESFLLLSTREQQRQRGLKKWIELQKESDPEARKELIHQLGEILTAERAYPMNKPSYLVFEYFGNLILRKKQIELIDQFIQKGDTNLIVELIMGSGKSKVLMPLLALLRANGENLSLLLVPEALFESISNDTKEILQNTFNLELETITFTRNTPIQPSHLRILRDKLQHVKESKGSVMMTNKSVQSFLLKYIELWYKVYGLNQKGKENLLSIELMSDILFMLRSSGTPLLDEVDTLLEILHEVCFSLGEILQPHAIDIKTVTDLYKILESLEMPQVITEKMYNDTYKQKIVDAWIKKSPFQDTPLLRDYLLRNPQNTEAAQKYFDSLNPEEQNILALIAEQINQYLPHTLSRVIDENYGHPEDLPSPIAIPFKATNIPSYGSEFANAHVTMNYTLQNYLKKGIDQKLLTEEWNKLQTKARKEIVEKGISLDKTESYKIFRKLAGTDIPFFGYKERDLVQLLEKVNSSTDSKLSFISSVLLPQIEIQSLKLSANAHHLVALFKSLCGFTGTLHNGKSMHSILTPKPAAGTDALTLDLLYSNQSEVAIISSSDDILSMDYTMVADAGGYFKVGGNALLAKKMALQKKQNVLFYTESGQVQVHNGKEAVDYSESKFPVGSFIAFLDQSRTTGADVKQPVNAVSINTIGPNTRLRDLLQTAWRLRGLQGQQRVKYAVTTEVAAIIRDELGLNSTHPITFVEILQYVVRNQAKLQERNNFKAFLHELQSIPQMLILEQMTDPSKPANMELFADLSRLWIHNQGKPSRELYGIIPQEVNGEVVFERMLTNTKAEVESLKKKYNMTFDWDSFEKRIRTQFTGYLPSKANLPLRDVDDQSAQLQKEIENEMRRDIERKVDLQKRSIDLGVKVGYKLYPAPFPSRNLKNQTEVPYYKLSEVLQDPALQEAFSDLHISINAFEWDKFGGEDQPLELFGFWRHPLVYLTKHHDNLVILSHRETLKDDKDLQLIDTVLGNVDSGTPLTDAERLALIKTKFLNGEVDYTPEELPLLESWVENYGPKRMRRFFEKTLLKDKDAYADSALDKAFSRLLLAEAV